eukprot:764272-Hanusia_phi.AAC.10
MKNPEEQLHSRSRCERAFAVRRTWRRPCFRRFSLLDAEAPEFTPSGFMAPEPFATDGSAEITIDGLQIDEEVEEVEEVRYATDLVAGIGHRMTSASLTALHQEQGQTMNIEHADDLVGGIERRLACQFSSHSKYAVLQATDSGSERGSSLRSDGRSSPTNSIDSVCKSVSVKE